jgi:hypothetical protein
MVLVLAAATPLALADEEVEAKPGEFCGICEAKKRFNELIPGMLWGFDARYRMIEDNNLGLNDTTDSDRYWHRLRLRAWTKITPIDDVDFHIRLVFEPRYYCCPESVDPPLQREEAIFDHLHVQWRNAFGLPLTVTGGRQDMRLGDGWLVFEGTPLDGSRTVFFDAIRLTYEAKDIGTTFEGIYIWNHADSGWGIHPFCDKDLDLRENDEEGVIFWVSNTSLVPNGVLDAYYIYKRSEQVATCGASSVGWTGDVHTVGLRVAGGLNEHWKYRAEVAPQWGNRNGVDICAFGANTELAYFFKDEMNNNVRMGYEFRSGSSNPEGGFDILWGRYPQWSELFLGYVDTLEGAPAMGSNLHRVNFGWSCNPMGNMTFALDYHLLFRNVNSATGVSTKSTGSSGFSQGGCFRGHLVTAVMTYRFDEHWSTHLVGEMFCPGSYYDGNTNDIAMFFRWQFVFSW